MYSCLPLQSDFILTETSQMNSDQISFNQCIKKRSKKNPYGVTWDYLPSIFFGAGTLDAYSGYLWKPGMEVDFPRDIVMHHANWTKGIKHKIAQLTYVRDKVRKHQKIMQQNA